MTYKSESRSIKNAENFNEKTSSSYNKSQERFGRQASLPASIDWRTRGYVNKIRDQSVVCGGCWAFSAICSLEGQYKNVTGELLEFSEQDLIDCDSSNNGCGGGFAFRAFQYLQKSGGIQGGQEFPYNARKVFFV